jgi:pyruvate/2-oxoglutarate dehydrogenase complex dihydrolipoamide acyltransferase (E2) component
MNVILKLPQLGMNMEEGKIQEWYKSPGEAVLKGERLYAVEIEKAIAEIEAPFAGKLIEVLAPVGMTVAIGAAVCRFEKVDRRSTEII